MTETRERSLSRAESAQIAIIGAMLVDERCVGDVLTRVRAADFITPRYRRLFEAAQALYVGSRPIDPVTVISRAGEDLRSVAKGCMDETPTAANVLTYCDILRDAAALYRVQRLCGELADARTLEDARALVGKMAEAMSCRPDVKATTLTEMMIDFLRRMEQPKPDYIRWGLPMLDSALLTEAGSYVIIGARPSTGKTALALQLALNIAEHKRVGFFSLETSTKRAADRIGAMSPLDIDLPGIKRRKLDPTAMQVLAVQAAGLEMFRRELHFIEAAGMTVQEIRTETLARRLDVIFIDYVQLIRPTDGRERTNQMQAVSMELRAMAQATGVVIVALAQLRRPDTQQKQKAATMADLKESGQFEQDADVVILMYHEDPGNLGSDRYIKIAKNKEGEAGRRARFRFDGRTQRFSYVDAKGNEPDHPKFTEIDDQEALPEWN